MRHIDGNNRAYLHEYIHLRAPTGITTADLTKFIQAGRHHRNHMMAKLRNHFKLAALQFCSQPTAAIADWFRRFRNYQTNSMLNGFPVSEHYCGVEEIADLFLNDRELILDIWSPILDVFPKDTFLNPHYDFFYKSLHDATKCILAEFVTHEIKVIDGTAPDLTNKELANMGTECIQRQHRDNTFWEDAPMAWPAPLRKQDWGKNTVSNPCTYGKLKGMASNAVTKEMVLDMVHDEALPTPALQKPLGLDVGEDISIEAHLEYFKALYDSKRQALDRLILRAREEQARVDQQYASAQEWAERYEHRVHTLLNYYNSEWSKYSGLVQQAKKLIEDGFSYETKIQRLSKPFPSTYINVRDALASFSGLLQWIQHMKNQKNRPLGFDDGSEGQAQDKDTTEQGEEEEPSVPAGLMMTISR
jgi:hypothetical protein